MARAVAQRLAAGRCRRTPCASSSSRSRPFSAGVRPSSAGCGQRGPHIRRDRRVVGQQRKLFFGARAARCNGGLIWAVEAPAQLLAIAQVHLHGKCGPRPFCHVKMYGAGWGGGAVVGGDHGDALKNPARGEEVAAAAAASISSPAGPGRRRFMPSATGWPGSPCTRFTLRPVALPSPATCSAQRVPACIRAPQKLRLRCTPSCPFTSKPYQGKTSA